MDICRCISCSADLSHFKARLHCYLPLLFLCLDDRSTCIQSAFSCVQTQTILLSPYAESFCQKLTTKSILLWRPSIFAYSRTQTIFGLKYLVITMQHRTRIKNGFVLKYFFPLRKFDVKTNNWWNNEMRNIQMDFYLIFYKSLEKIAYAWNQNKSFNFLLRANFMQQCCNSFSMKVLIQIF